MTYDIDKSRQFEVDIDGQVVFVVADWSNQYVVIVLKQKIVVQSFGVRIRIRQVAARYRKE